MLTIKERNYRVKGYDVLKKDVYFLDGSGDVKQVKGPGWVMHIRFLIVDPVPVRHTFGRVIFEETGEVRVPRQDEWWLTKLDGGKAAFRKDSLVNTEVPILVPVGLVDEGLDVEG